MVAVLRQILGHDADAMPASADERGTVVVFEVGPDDAESSRDTLDALDALGPLGPLSPLIHHQRGRRRRRSPPPPHDSTALPRTRGVTAASYTLKPRPWPLSRQPTPSSAGTFRGRRRHRSPPPASSAAADVASSSLDPLHRPRAASPPPRSWLHSRLRSRSRGRRYVRSLYMDTSVSVASMASMASTTSIASAWSDAPSPRASPSPSPSPSPSHSPSRSRSPRRKFMRAVDMDLLHYRHRRPLSSRSDPVDAWAQDITIKDTPVMVDPTHATHAAVRPRSQRHRRPPVRTRSRPQLQQMRSGEGVGGGSGSGGGNAYYYSGEDAAAAAVAAVAVAAVTAAGRTRDPGHWSRRPFQVQPTDTSATDSDRDMMDVEAE